MPTLTTNIAGLLCAGNGSRLRDSLVETGELVKVGDDYYFINAGEAGEPGKPFEKPLTYIVYPDPKVAGDKGVTVLDLAVKDVLRAKTIRFLTNQNSTIPTRYGKRINTRAFLKRLGLPPLVGPGTHEYVNCEYIIQPPKTEAYPYYGTAWAFYLVSQGIELADNELMLITETDSAFFNPAGVSIPNMMVEAMRDNPRGATAGLSVAPLLHSVSRKNGLGMALLEQDGDAFYFHHIYESAGHGNLAEAESSEFSLGRNTTRVAADRLLLEINDKIAMIEPAAVNKGERQATDTYNARAEVAPVLAFNNPPDVVWRDSGKFEGLLLLRNDLAGLADAKNPVWGPSKTT